MVPVRETHHFVADDILAGPECRNDRVPLVRHELARTSSWPQRAQANSTSNPRRRPDGSTKLKVGNGVPCRCGESFRRVPTCTANDHPVANKRAIGQFMTLGSGPLEYTGWTRPFSSQCGTPALGAGHVPHASHVQIYSGKAAAGDGQNDGRDQDDAFSESTPFRFHPSPCLQASEPLFPEMVAWSRDRSSWSDGDGRRPRGKSAKPRRPRSPRDHRHENGRYFAPTFAPEDAQRDLAWSSGRSIQH